MDSSFNHEKQSDEKPGLGRSVVSFEDCDPSQNNINDDRTSKSNKKHKLSASSSKGVEVIVPTSCKALLKPDQGNNQNMVSKTYSVTTSDEEKDDQTLKQQQQQNHHEDNSFIGGYFTRKSTARASNSDRRGTVNTINTNVDEEEDEDIDTRRLKNLTDDAFDRYYRRKVWFLILIRACCVANVISVCMNTPQTFKAHPWLRKLTFVVDIVTGVILVCEAIIKILHKGFIRNKKSYLRSGGRIFEFVMVICIFASIALQGYEMTMTIDEIEKNINNQYLKISFIRALRPLLLLRFMKTLLNLSLPKTVSYRSMKQIWGVFMFTCYFIVLAGLLGIQMFGLMNFYCVKKGTNTTTVKQTDLLIPNTRCRPPGYEDNGFNCPNGFVCENLVFSRQFTDRRPFDQILLGLLTVYEASSMEGWSNIMYAAIDIRFFLFAVLYNLALIVFVSILVKNVFIAIITEAFADLRLQVSKLSAHSTQPKEVDICDYKVLRRADDNVSLVDPNDILNRSVVRHLLWKWTRHWLFQCIIYTCVLADAIIQSFFNHHSFARYVQIVFTILFLIESILKIIAYGTKQYFQSTQYVFELVISIGSTIFLAPVILKRDGFVVFQVMRPFRLVLIWSSLRSFLKRILGSGRKIGSLILFTLTALIIAAGISLQLFCGTGLPMSTGGDPYPFATFPLAIKALFQIFMTEGWVEIMDDVLYRGGFGFAFLVFPLFIFFHLLAATILISVFVALILDNLELEEDVKIAKQRRLGEEVVDKDKKLPARMRLYQNLKPRPKLTKIDYVDTTLPKIRQSFVNKYVEMGDEIEEEVPVITNTNLRYSIVHESGSNETLPLNFIENQPVESISLNQFRKQSSVSTLMQGALNKRMSINSHNGTIKRQKTMTKSFRHGLARSSVTAGSRRSRDHFHSASSSASSTASRGSLGNKGRVNIKLSNQVGDRSKNIDVGAVRQKLEEAQRKKQSQIEHIRENHPFFDKSLFIFSVNNPVRKFVQKIVHTRYNAEKDEKRGHVGGFSIERLKNYLATQTWLDWGMLICTQVSVLAMLWETPEKRTFDSTTLTVIEYIFVVTTSIELVLKIIADGLFFAPNAFIRDVGNVLHVFIYLVSLIYLIWKPALISVGSLAQVIIVLRALRPLRLITLAPPLRKVVNVLLSGYKAIIKVAILQVALMFVFASYGVQYLGGRLKKCNDPDMKTEANCTGVFKIKIAGASDFKSLSGDPPPILVPRVWRNPRNFNFDNMGQAFLALLEILSLEGWTDVRDIIEEQVGFFGSLYPHVYVFFASLIGLTLFIGVIVSNFNENKGTALLTVEQKRWKDLEKKIRLAQPLHLPSRPPMESIRHKLFEIVIGKTYNRCYGILIIINCAMLCTGQWVPTERMHIPELTYVSMVCCVLFFFDTILKIYIFQWSGYWLSWRNRFDFLLMTCGLIFVVWNLAICHGSHKVEEFCNVSKQFGVAVFILRFVSLSGKHNVLRMLMLTVVISLTKSFYTIAVLVCIMFCYAFVGVIMFGSVKPGLAINRKVNFNTSFKALLLLFRVTTGEDWNKLMHDAKISKPYCTERPNENYWLSNCGSPTFATLYFHSYYLIISYIFLNLFIAVVIENFSIFYSTDDDPIMSQQDIQCFQETWNLCDDEKSGHMDLVRAKVVLRLLKGGLALDKMRERKPLIFRRMVAELEKVKGQKKVTFHNLLFVLAYNKIDISTSLQLDERLQREELEMAILEEVATETIREWITGIAAKVRKQKKNKNKVERKLSGISSNSWYSNDSFNSDADDLNASTISLNQLSPQVSNALSPSSSYDAPSYDPPAPALRLRRGTSDWSRDSRKSTEVYSWWDDMVEEKSK